MTNNYGLGYGMNYPTTPQLVPVRDYAGNVFYVEAPAQQAPVPQQVPTQQQQTTVAAPTPEPEEGLSLEQKAKLYKIPLKDWRPYAEVNTEQEVIDFIIPPLAAGEMFIIALKDGTATYGKRINPATLTPEIVAFDIRAEKVNAGVVDSNALGMINDRLAKIEEQNLEMTDFMRMAQTLLMSQVSTPAETSQVKRTPNKPPAAVNKTKVNEGVES